MEPLVIYSINDIEKYKEQLKKFKIFVCLTASGKSWLCQHDNRFFDLDVFSCNLKDNGDEKFVEKSVSKMYELIDEGKIVLNASHKWFMKYLGENKIPFVMMYEKAECQEEYIQRMRNRGSSEDFIQRFGTIIADHYQHHVDEKRATIKIEMSSNEYVADYLLKIFN